MQKFQIPNEILLQAISWILGIASFLLVGSISLVAYIFTKFRSDNDCEHERIETAMCDYRKEIREDINKIHNRIDRHLEDE
jgi:signal transduction protein with GAF and PtsI domain